MEQLMTVGEVARAAGVVSATVRVWHIRGTLRAATVTASGMRLFARSEVERLIDARRQKADTRLHVSA